MSLDLTIISIIFTLVSLIGCALVPTIKTAGVSWPEENPEHKIGLQVYDAFDWDRAPADLTVSDEHLAMKWDGETENVCLCWTCYSTSYKSFKRKDVSRIPIVGRSARNTEVLTTYMGVEITNQDVDLFFAAA